jgi:glycosyltransferase involved in cell wall biosynthesis
LTALRPTHSRTSPGSTDADATVLHVTEAFGGGLLEVIRLIVRAGAQTGARHAIAYGRRPETPVDTAAAIGADIELIDLDWRRRSPLSHVEVARNLRALCRTRAPDVVHLHSSFAGVVGAVALQDLVPLVYTPHAFASEIDGTSWLRRKAFRTLERVAVRQVQLVGAVSGSEAATAHSLGAHNLICIPNGIPELDGIEQAGPAVVAQPPRVIAVGRLIAQRRPAECARILKGVRDLADIGWIGGGAVDSRARRAGLRALTEAGAPPTGWMGRDAVLSELRRATAYVHWTTWDGQAMTVLEAMACDAVVVASDIPPNRDLLDERQLCRSEGDAIALLRRILTDHEFAQELLVDQRRRAAAHSAARMTERWLSVYGELSAARRHRG